MASNLDQASLRCREPSGEVSQGLSAIYRPLATYYAGNVTSVADSGTPQLDNFSSFTGTVAGLSGQDGMELRDIGFSANTSTSYQANTGNAGGTLSVCDGVHTADLALLGNYLAVAFLTSNDGHGGNLISEQETTSQFIAASHST